ncbi:MAG: TRAP transporter small permease [Deltaproteobacteria bacterium]|nr:TRAP transporter small permease [Deltaproteobacteria bacterium]
MFFAIPLMFITTFDAMGRSFFSKPLPGAVELCEYMLCVIVLLGAGYTQQIKGHVGVDFVTSRLSPQRRRIIQLITNVLSMIVISILTYQGFTQALEEKTVSDMLRIPQKPFRFLVFVAGLLLLAEFSVEFLRLLRKREEG